MELRAELGQPIPNEIQATRKPARCEIAVRRKHIVGRAQFDLA
jgi:hypothetical protein